MKVFKRPNGQNGHQDCFSISIKAICDRYKTSFDYAFMANFYFDFLDQEETILKRVFTAPENIDRYPLNINHDLAAKNYMNNDEGIRALSEMRLEDAALLGAPARDIPWFYDRTSYLMHYFVVFKTENNNFQVVDPIFSKPYGNITLQELEEILSSIMITRIETVPTRSLADTSALFLDFLRLYAQPGSNNTAQDRVDRFLKELRHSNIEKELEYQGVFEYVDVIPIVRITKSFSNNPMLTRDFLSRVEQDYGIDLDRVKQRLVNLSSMWKKECILFIMSFTNKDFTRREKEKVVSKFKTIFDEELDILHDLMDHFERLRLSAAVGERVRV